VPIIDKKKMIEVICRIEDKFQIEEKEYFKLNDVQSVEEYIVPLNQLFDDNLVLGNEYKFYKQYNSKLERYFIIQEHPTYKLNKTYEFEIVRKEYYEENGNISAFIISDNYNNEIRILPNDWQLENWVKSTLACQVVAYSRKGLILKNCDFSNLPYEVGNVYEFNILKFGTYKNNKGIHIPSVILENKDGYEISVTALKWQNEKIWNYKTLFCEVLKYNSIGTPHLKNRDERHPLFEVEKKYNFIIKSLKTKIDLNNNNKKCDIIELLGLDGCTHETRALPGQMRTLHVGDGIQCIVKSIGFNLRLEQTNIIDPYYSTIEEIVKDKDLIKKFFFRAITNKEDESSIELASKYESKHAFWVFTFCNKILTKYFIDYIERFDYKSSRQVADLIIIIENWIIKNGIISSFPDENARKNTLLKAKQQLNSYSKKREVLTILEGQNLSDYFKKKRTLIGNEEIEEFYYLFLFSDINQIEENLLVTSLSQLLCSITIDKENSYILVQLDKSIQQKKKTYYKNEYEKSFNLSFINDSLFSNEINKNKYFSLSFCQYLINEKLQNFERANYLVGKILRQYFFSVSNNDLKEKILFNAYYFQNNQNKINEHPFEYSNKLTLIEEKLIDNPNCCNSQSESWMQIKDSFEHENLILVNITQKEFNGFVVDYKGIKGFLPINHINDRNLKYYSQSKIDFTISVQCILLSEEFNFYVAKQPNANVEGYICNNNLSGIVKIGELIEGQIKSIEEYGIFVSSYWGDGLLHRANISNHLWDRKNLQTYFRIGNRITTKVISIEDKKVGLSFKELIGTVEEDKYFDFVNYVDFGDMFVKEYKESISDDLLIDDVENKFNQLEKAFCFEQYAILKKGLDDKIHFLRLSKQFFSSVNNARSYLINIYTNYFELLKFIEDVINSFSFEKVEKIKTEAQIILEKINSQKQTLEVYPESNKLIFFINIISLFNNTTEAGINTLFELLQKNSDQKILKTITKITLANNLLISESEEYSDFVRKNLRHIKSYLDDGVLSLKESESDKREREVQENVKYWSGRINEDESETQEFKSTFKTPIPDEKSLKEKAKLLSLLKDTPNHNAILSKIDLIDGESASKRVIHSSLKTLCAFANSNGGTLIIGVADDKSIVGLEKDYINLKGKQNRDGFGLFFDSKVKEYFESSFSSLLTRDFLRLPGGDILIVNVKQSFDPIFLLKNEEGKACEELFVRNLTSTKEIKEKRELVKFVKQKEKEQLKLKIDE